MKLFVLECIREEVRVVKRTVRDIVISAMILILTFLVSHGFLTSYDTDALVPLIFVMAVFLISAITRGYTLGIISALLSVLAVNYAFTFPYFEFNFTIPENLISAIILIVVTLVTSTLTTKIINQEKIKVQAGREQMRANLLRAISHDLRTPLTAIYGASSTVIDNYDNLTDESKIDMLGGIREDSQWLIRMVENLLSVTKIDTNSVKLIKSPVVLDELIDSVIGKLKSRYPMQTVKLAVPDEFIIISADAILIEQVLLNILENAVQHAKGMTELELKVTAADDKAIFSVTDDGCGMDKERVKNVFSGDFISGVSPTDGNKQNMGIGLSVCATIVRAHGGEIKVKNNKPKGITFTFSLDMEAAE